MKLHASRVIRILAVAWIASFLIACAASGKPSVIVMSPPSGSQYTEGEDIAIQTSATDATGIVRVELVVDGISVRVDPSPTAQGQPNFMLIQTWKATTGVHTILVRAYNTTGAVSDPAGISVNVLPRIAQVPTPTATIPPPPPPPGATITASPVPPTVTPTATSQPPAPTTCTNTAAFVQDVTVPDGTSWAPGQAFNKIWQVRNTGTCTWSGYQLAFASGEAMTTNSTAAVPTTAPGASADILVPMTAPSTSGTHASQWRLRSPGGLFGPTLSVSINVTGGGGSPPSPSGCSGTPVIASFSASVASVTAGNPVTLNWGAVTNAESAEIDHGIGGIETPGSRTVNPTVYTTYTLTARCGANVATRQVAVAVLAPPAVIADLSVANVEFNPAVPAPGGSFQIKTTINNSGSVAANNFNVRALRQTVGAACPSGPGTVLFDRSTSVGANTSTVHTENTSIASSGDYAICIILDHTGVINETNKNNNALQKNLTVGLPDLYVQNVGMSDWTPNVGQSVNVTINIRNGGVAPAGSFYVRYLRQAAADSCSGGPGTVVFDTTVSSLAAGAATSVTRTLAWPSPAGTYHYCAILDHGHSVTESNEGNNILTTGNYAVGP
jgi:hypothetical protein